jgi:hypothetical protein
MLAKCSHPVLASQGATTIFKLAGGISRLSTGCEIHLSHFLFWCQGSALAFFCLIHYGNDRIADINPSPALATPLILLSGRIRERIP